MQITLKKGFKHLGKDLKEGDEFIGDPGEIIALIQQGYADDPGGVFLWGWTLQPGVSPQPAPATPLPGPATIPQPPQPPEPPPSY